MAREAKLDMDEYAEKRQTDVFYLLNS